MLASFHNNVDQVIIAPEEYEEEKKRLKWIFRGVSIYNYEIISIMTSSFI